MRPLDSHFSVTLNLMLSLHLGPRGRDLSHPLSQAIWKLTLSRVRHGNHSVYLLIRPSRGSRAAAPLPAAWGPDKSRPAWSCQRREEVWGSTRGLALRNDAISACAAVSPSPLHKLDPAERVTEDSAGDGWVVTHTRAHWHTCHRTCKYGYCSDGQGGAGRQRRLLIKCDYGKKEIVIWSNSFKCRCNNSRCFRVELMIRP